MALRGVTGGQEAAAARHERERPGVAARARSARTRKASPARWRAGLRARRPLRARERDDLHEGMALGPAAASSASRAAPPPAVRGRDPGGRAPTRRAPTGNRARCRRQLERWVGMGPAFVLATLKRGDQRQGGEQVAHGVLLAGLAREPEPLGGVRGRGRIPRRPPPPSERGTRERRAAFQRRRSPAPGRPRGRRARARSPPPRGSRRRRRREPGAGDPGSARRGRAPAWRRGAPRAVSPASRLPMPTIT